MTHQLLYFAGPGDIVSTFRLWLAGNEDLSSPSRAYSGQFFEFCKEQGLTARVISRCPRADRLAGEGIAAENRPRASAIRGIRYHVARFTEGARTIREVARSKPKVILLQEGTCPFWAAAACRLFGARVIVDLHCALWPDQYPPTRPIPRLLQAIDSFWLRHAADILQCISPIIERQVCSSSGIPRKRCRQARPAYVPESIPFMPPPKEFAPLRVFSAGRIEEEKGFSDLVAAVGQIHKQRPGSIHCRIAGDGSFRARLQTIITSAGLETVVELPGQLQLPEMLKEFERCHLVVAPTTSRFAEGLNRVCIEGVLSGRPVISTSVCPVGEILGEANITIPPDNPELLAHAIESIARSQDELARRFEAARKIRKVLLDPQLYWGNVTRQSVLDLLKRS